MHLYIIRHAQSTNNLLWLKSGSSVGRDPDPGLSETGQQQKVYLAQFLARRNAGVKSQARDPRNLTGFGITHLYCSLMRRAVETALDVGQHLDLSPVGWIDLHETGGLLDGDGEIMPYVGLPGKPRSFFEQQYPRMALRDAFGEEGWYNRPFEGEEERSQRAKRVVAQLIEGHYEASDHVAVVTHGAFYNYLMRELLGVADRQVWFEMCNAAVTRWDLRKDRDDPTRMVRIVDYMNRLDFLPDHLVTP